MSELDAWSGEFGEAYTQRNVADWRSRLPAFTEMIEGLPIKRVLEVGCNRGHNLVAFSEILGEEAEITAVEPNPVARELARASSTKISVLAGNAYQLPFVDGYFDLAFTAGVLIHIPPARFPEALSEIYRVSRRYIMASEYFAEEETIVPYHGRDDLLWKRNFAKCYQDQFPDLKVVRSGYNGPERGFDRCHWWVLEKGGN